LKGTLAMTDGGPKIAGTWSKPDGSHPLAFSLAEVRNSAGGLHIVTKTFAVAETKFKKIVNAKYPLFEGSTDAKVARLNTEIEKWVATTVKEFEGDVTENSLANDADALALDIDYEVTVATNDVASVVFYIYTNFGGAHPSSYKHAVNFDLRDGRAMRLADLFADKTHYLAALAQRCAPVFRGGDDLSADTSAKAENYNTWYLTPNGLTIVFEVPHVVGDTADAFIPYAALRGLLDPAGPAASVAK
jgi:hypothetical protein